MHARFERRALNGRLPCTPAADIAALSSNSRCSTPTTSAESTLPGRLLDPIKTFERPTQARLGRTRLGVLLGAVHVPGKNGIAAIELRQQPLHEARRRRTGRQPVVNPLTVANPLDQPGLTEDAQMSANARLALPTACARSETLRSPWSHKRKQPQSAGLARRLQPRN